MTRLLRWFRPFAFVAAVLGLGVALWVERDGISSFPWRLAWPSFVAAVLMFGLAPLVGATSFWLLLSGISAGGSSPAETAVVWMRSFLARYVPSGALTLAVRLRACERLGVTRRELLGATALEQVVAAVGGAVVTLAVFGVDGRRPPLVAAGILIAAVAVALGVRRTRGHKRLLLQVTVLNAGAWVVNGIAVWILVRALVPSPPAVLFLVSAYAFAWLIGFVIVFAPSGLGVREATLIALLSPQLGPAAATGVAVVLRFANIVGDVVAFGAVELAVSLRRALRGPVRLLPPSPASSP
jgi:glycosyltransferase 2 family protein